jgi:hypothetical protein
MHGAQTRKDEASLNSARYGRRKPSPDSARYRQWERERERERERIYGKDGDGQWPLESQHYRKDRIYGKDGDGQWPLESQHYRKDRIYGKDGEDVTAKLASLLLRTCSCRRVSRDVRSRR